jgi:hydrogenase expression/formation protein HypC
MCLALPAQVVALVEGAESLGLIERHGVRRAVELRCVLDEGQPPEALIGQWVLVHVGFALSRLDRREAAQTLALLERALEETTPLTDVAPAGAAPSGAAPVGTVPEGTPPIGTAPAA